MTTWELHGKKEIERDAEKNLLSYIERVVNYKEELHSHNKNLALVRDAVKELVSLDIVTVSGKGTAIKEYGIKWSGIGVIQDEHLES